MKTMYIKIFTALFLLFSLILVRSVHPSLDDQDNQKISWMPAKGQTINILSDNVIPNSDLIYWFDNFEYKDPRWDWDYEQGEAERELVSLPNGNPGLKIWVKSEANSSGYSDCSLREISEDYLFGVMEAHLRLTDDNGLTDDGKGTRGWGFWDGNLEVLNVAWFWSASPESDLEISGFRVMVMRNNEFLLNQEIQIDMREWHTYRVEITQEGTKFFVDNVEIASTEGRPAKQQRIELWVDNMAIQVNNGIYSTKNLNLIQDQAMYIDWVEYRSSPVQSPPTEPPPTEPPPTQSPPTEPPPTPSNHQIFLPWLKR
jgi:hypothetical protein